MFKLVLEKAEEPEIKLPTSTESSKKQESSRKNIYLCFIDCVKAFDCVDHNKQWKILREMGIADHLICLLRNLYAGQEATVRTRHRRKDWFQIRKGVVQGCMFSPCIFNFYAKKRCKTLGWMKQKLDSRFLREISITSDMQMTPPLWQKVKRNYRVSWWWWKRRVNKLAWYSTFKKLKDQKTKSIWSHHFMANRWRNNGNSGRFLFSWAPKSLQIMIAAMKLKDACSLEETLWPI